jgi:hypothetical protein
LIEPPAAVTQIFGSQGTLHAIQQQAATLRILATEPPVFISWSFYLTCLLSVLCLLLQVKFTGKGTMEI